MLHTPPPMLDALTLEEFEAGCAYIDALTRPQEV